MDAVLKQQAMDWFSSVLDHPLMENVVLEARTSGGATVPAINVGSLANIFKAILAILPMLPGLFSGGFSVQALIGILTVILQNFGLSASEASSLAAVMAQQAQTSKAQVPMSP